MFSLTDQPFLATYCCFQILPGRRRKQSKLLQEGEIVDYLGDDLEVLTISLKLSYYQLISLSTGTIDWCLVCDLCMPQCAVKSDSLQSLESHNNLLYFMVTVVFY